MTGPEIRRFRAAAAAWTVGAVMYLSAEALAASARPSYHYAGDYISDLGVPGTPLAPLMNTAFAVQGSMFLLGAVLAAPRRRLLLVCASANAVGNVLVATVPAGHGPLHLIGAGLAIVGGNAAALAGATLAARPGYRVASRLLGTIGLVAAAGLVSQALLPAPVWERAAVYPILAWQLLAAAALLPARRQHA